MTWAISLSHEQYEQVIHSLYKHWQVLFTCFKNIIICNCKCFKGQNRMLFIKLKVKQQKIKADLWWSLSAWIQQMLPIVGCETDWTSLSLLTLIHWSITDINKEKDWRFDSPNGLFPTWEHWAEGRWHETASLSEPRSVSSSF